MALSLLLLLLRQAGRPCPWQRAGPLLVTLLVAAQLQALAVCIAQLLLFKLRQMHLVRVLAHIIRLHQHIP
jgi:hypothetical protein